MVRKGSEDVGGHTRMHFPISQILPGALLLLLLSCSEVGVVAHCSAFSMAENIKKRRTLGLFDLPAPPEPVTTVQKWCPQNHGVHFKRCRNGAGQAHDVTAPSLLSVPTWCMIEVCSRYCSKRAQALLKPRLHTSAVSTQAQRLVTPQHANHT